jgi:hypothetical protein
VVFLVITIIAMNTLIALIADSYDKVQNNSQKYDFLKKLELLLELNYIYSVYYKFRPREVTKKMFLHVL